MALDAMAIRELTDDELSEEIGRAREELARLRYRAAFEDLENPSLVRTLRRDIARLLTIAGERAAAAGKGAAEENPNG